MFTSEEPTRFKLSCIGSRAMAGALTAKTLNKKLDENGTSFLEVGGMWMGFSLLSVPMGCGVWVVVLPWGLWLWGFCVPMGLGVWGLAVLYGEKQIKSFNGTNLVNTPSTQLLHSKAGVLLIVCITDLLCRT